MNTTDTFKDLSQLRKGLGKFSVVHIPIWLQGGASGIDRTLPFEFLYGRRVCM